MRDRLLSKLPPDQLLQRPKEEVLQEIERLRKVELAFDAQDEMLRSLVVIGQTATGRLMLRSMLQTTIKVSVKLTDAHESSLFLLNSKGAVTESILARGATIKEQKEHLIGKVLDSGLAGWVVERRQVGLITDTRKDERWITLPDQPYTVGSALCVPILRGKVLLGILTLTHSEPNHFNEDLSDLMQMCARQMALALDNARLYVREHGQKEQLAAQKVEEENIKEEDQDLAHLGFYIIAENGKFLYANTRIAEIFGYEFGELVTLKSILKLVATTHYHQVAEIFSQCVQGYNPILSCRFKGQRKDRRSVDIEIYGTRTKFYGKYVVIGILRLI
ncbi:MULTISPECIES: GAF domain-containing protein [Spirulina sp. CCY15215]|uniref:GAF domain-containing protein n=1 Tax=Spirulina sp. CCY15215 TaxID=2767591 RepID=UPI001950B58E|nr:GAF domain-containing protein [Spirulina major]